MNPKNLYEIMQRIEISPDAKQADQPAPKQLQSFENKPGIKLLGEPENKIKGLINGGIKMTENESHEDNKYGNTKSSQKKGFFSALFRGQLDEWYKVCSPEFSPPYVLFKLKNGSKIKFWIGVGTDSGYISNFDTYDNMTQYFKNTMILLEQKGKTVEDMVNILYKLDKNNDSVINAQAIKELAQEVERDK